MFLYGVIRILDEYNEYKRKQKKLLEMQKLDKECKKDYEYIRRN